jgi:Fe-S-cluster-containing dehydrogenase component
MTKATEKKCGIFNLLWWNIAISSEDDTEATCTQYQNLSRTQIYTETKLANSDVCEKGIAEENANLSTDEQNGSSELATTDVCHHCLNSPCVTAGPQAWLGDGRSAKLEIT